MGRKSLQKKRIMKYFIDASIKIIETEGVSNVTIRKVSDLAGYNSATLYNYFENLDHLLFYSSIKYLRNYLIRLQNMEIPKNCKEKFFLIWKNFAEEAFANSTFFYQIFYMNYDMSFNDAIKQYYEIYPEELANLSKDLLPMLTETNIYKRDLEVLSDCVKGGVIQQKDLEAINDMIVMIFQGFLLKIKDNENQDIDENVNKFMDYLGRIFDAHSNNRQIG